MTIDDQGVTNNELFFVIRSSSLDIRHSLFLLFVFAVLMQTIDNILT